MFLKIVLAVIGLALAWAEMYQVVFAQRQVRKLTGMNEKEYVTAEAALLKQISNDPGYWLNLAISISMMMDLILLILVVLGLFLHWGSVIIGVAALGVAVYRIKEKISDIKQGQNVEEDDLKQDLVGKAHRDLDETKKVTHRLWSFSHIFTTTMRLLPAVWLFYLVVVV